MTRVRSPLGIEFEEGVHGWRRPVGHHFLDDLLVGYEMGYAAATRDPWDARCRLEVLMVEA